MTVIHTYRTHIHMYIHICIHINSLTRFLGLSLVIEPLAQLTIVHTGLPRGGINQFTFEIVLLRDIIMVM